MLTQDFVASNTGRVATNTGQDESGGHKLNAEQFCRLALSRRKLSRKQQGRLQMLLDEETGDLFWIEEAQISSYSVYR